MKKSLVVIGQLAGLVGIALCVGSGVARLSGMHWLGRFETLTILQAGIAGLALGCFCLLLALTKDLGQH